MKTDSKAALPQPNEKNTVTNRSEDTAEAQVVYDSFNMVDITEIDLKQGIQCRVAIDLQTVQNYAEQMRNDEEFPPITVYEIGSSWILADGHHRLLAAKEAGKTEILALFKTGTRAEALQYSIKANASRKLSFTHADKNRAVKMAVEAFGTAMSNRDIAKLCCVSPSLVDKIRNAYLPLKGTPPDGKGKTELIPNTKAAEMMPAAPKTDNLSQPSSKNTAPPHPEEENQFSDSMTPSVMAASDCAETEAPTVGTGVSKIAVKPDLKPIAELKKLADQAYDIAANKPKRKELLALIGKLKRELELWAAWQEKQKPQPR